LDDDEDDEKPITIVFIIGGLTYSEISAIKTLE